MAEKFKQLLAVTPFVFVYGTLKRTYGNNHILVTSEFTSQARTLEDNLILYNSGFPYMIESDYDQGGLVAGELYKVDDPQVLEALDLLEGVEHNHYTRCKIEVLNAEDMVIEAWAYFAHESNRSSVERLPKCPEYGGVYAWG